MARLPARRSQPSGSHANPRSSSVPERKRARIVEFNSGHLKPFDYGFRREMVVRGTVPGQDGGRIMSDIYYYTPTGTKLRSMPEVSAYLAKNRKLPLTADNFNFKRATIHQPPHEVVRNAGPRHSGKFKSARVTRQSAPAALEPASPVPASPAAVPALPASAVEHAKSLCAATLSGRRKARKPLCGCCESRHEWHQQVHKDAPGHHHLHRAASKKWPGHGVPQAYRRAPKPTVVPSGRRSQPPVAQNTTYAKVPADESAAHTEDTKGGEPEESSVAYESPRKSVSPSKLQQVTEECAVQPSVRHAVVLVNDILKPEVGEKAASDADRVLATPKACADSWQNATARELYRVLTRWQNASEQAAATATEDDLLGDPVIIKEGTEPLGASPALDPEGSSVLSSQSKPAAVSREPCTARCSRATGETPELQCKRCLCFFHPICIGLSHLATTKGRFVCKWKRVNFSHFHVHDWDACVKMLRDMRTEELVLERDSLEPVLCRITMLDTVKHVALEVNPLQLARVARAFPHLHSISALISRRGTAEPRHPASLGGLSELLCVAGLERLELRGAHGLAILPLTMSPNCLAQRCHQLRALSLVTVQNMTPEVVFLISLLHGLEELHLGECIKWSETSFLNISKLKKLRRLTLEHGEDKSGFRSMLLRLSNLERLELKQWTLRNSLADTLPHMTLLRHLLLCPVNGDLASKTNRNVLRSCLAAGATLKQITWVVSCKSSTSPQGVFDLNLAFEPGNLCDCPSIIAASNPADVPVSTPGGSLRNADISPEAQEVASGHLQCCAFAKKFRHMWKPSLHLAWYMTVRQVCQGLKRCLGPHTAVCFCAQVEQ
ncbi:uncharacterized protein LOC144132256 isoform X14 [Amblyomma americanum]